jgi:hypothetical protein
VSQGVHDPSPVIFNQLKEKFPDNPNLAADCAPFVETSVPPLQIDPDDVLTAINSFPSETGAGKVGLKAEHLKGALFGPFNFYKDNPL